MDFTNWVRPADGEPLAAVRVTHHLSRSELAALLIQRLQPHYRDELVSLSKALAETLIREQLKISRDAARFWADEYGEASDGEVSAEEAEEWARRQVAKL